MSKPVYVKYDKQNRRYFPMKGMGNIHEDGIVYRVIPIEDDTLVNKVQPLGEDGPISLTEMMTLLNYEVNRDRIKDNSEPWGKDYPTDWEMKRKKRV